MIDLKIRKAGSCAKVRPCVKGIIDIPRQVALLLLLAALCGAQAQPPLVDSPLPPADVQATAQALCHSHSRPGCRSSGGALPHGLVVGLALIRRLLASSGEQVQARLQLADALAAATSKDHQPAGVDDTPTSAATSHASSR